MPAELPDDVGCNMGVIQLKLLHFSESTMLQNRDYRILVCCTWLMERRYLFNDLKNDIYYINQNTVKHKHKDLFFAIDI